MSRWDETLELTRRIQLAGSPAAICTELLRVTSRYGLNHLIAGTIPPPGKRPNLQRQHILFAGWPDDWMRRYVERSYVYVDPVIRHVQNNPGLPFRWQEARPAEGRESDVQTMWGEAGDHGLGDGLAIPFVTLEGDIATVSFGGERTELSPASRGMIQMAGIFAVGRAFQLSGKEPRHGRLSPRELECLKWTASGKSEWEISVILGVGEATVRTHLLHARDKLGAVNKYQMIYEAARTGLIS